MQALYTVFLKPCEGGYTARVPDVPGCVTGGATIEECVEMARDALCGCLCVYEDEGVELAPQRPLDALEHDPDEIAALIEIDTLKYRMATETKAVRKNVSMPAWLANMADRQGINLSQLLQRSVREALNI